MDIFYCEHRLFDTAKHERVPIFQFSILCSIQKEKSDKSNKAKHVFLIFFLKTRSK